MDPQHQVRQVVGGAGTCLKEKGPPARERSLWATHRGTGGRMSLVLTIKPHRNVCPEAALAENETSQERTGPVTNTVGHEPTNTLNAMSWCRFRTDTSSSIGIADERNSPSSSQSAFSGTRT